MGRFQGLDMGVVTRVSLPCVEKKRLEAGEVVSVPATCSKLYEQGVNQETLNPTT